MVSAPSPMLGKPSIASADNPLRILHIFDHSVPLQSGYTFRSCAILHEQARQGFKTVHLTTWRHSAAGPNPETVDGLVFHRTPRTRGQALTLFSRVPILNLLAEIWSSARALDARVAQEKPHILHAHSPVLNALAALYVGWRRHLPVVYEIRATWEDAAVANGTIQEGSWRYRITRILETFAAKRAAFVGVICQGLAHEMRARGIASEKLFIVPNAVDLAHFQRSTQKDLELLQELALEGCTVIGFLGSFYAYEGLDILVEAFAKLSAHAPKLRLLLVGGGPQEAALKAQIATLGVQEKVLMPGRVPHAQVDRYYSLVDILAYPRKRTRVTELVTPLKPLEAMAQGKLVLASDVGGHKELIRAGLNGALFKADDANDLARSLEQLLAQQEKWPRYQRAGLKFVRLMRNWHRTLSAYPVVYKNIL
jgi:glycogen synthase